MEIKEVFQVKEIETAIELLSQYGGASRILAGGTDLIIGLREGRETPSVLIDISSVEEMKLINEREDWIELGAAVTFSDLLRAQSINNGLRGLKEAARSVGSPQIRNAATIGGNICNASPAADIIPPLLALEAILMIRGVDGSREMRLEDFLINGGRKTLSIGELVIGVKFKKSKGNQGLGFSKLGFRKALAISRISTAVFLELQEGLICREVRIANGSVGRYGLREREIEKFLKGRVFEKSTLQDATQLMKAEIEKRLRGRHSADFKKEAVQGILMMALENAFQSIELKGGIGYENDSAKG